jgi:cellulose synthase/poly-beta-1,6-N-acetylglucosamine synthase-like glycosyltransferase
MKWVFWISAAILAYMYLGYAGWLWLRCRFRQLPVKAGANQPRISVVMVVRNEAAILERKLKNLLSLDYPKELSEIVVVSDGSTDGSNEILHDYSADPRLRVILHPEPRGKAAGLNDSVAQARGEIVVFTDARQILERDSVRLLAEQFADPQVGCASGELMLGDPDAGETSRGFGLYWRLEKKIREMESASGSVVQATGAIYAVRRNLLVPVPAGTILDDVFIPMHVARQGYRVTFLPTARAWDVADQGSDREFSRKVRTLTGNYQLVQLAPWLLGSSNPLRFELISHKLLRLAAPFLLAALLLSTLFLSAPPYRIALLLQVMLYGLSGAAMAKLAVGPLGRVADAARTFVVLNTAAFVAFVNFVTGRGVAWVR